jgi:membrane-associated phospholipid phosphatase
MKLALGPKLAIVWMALAALAIGQTTGETPPTGAPSSDPPQTPVSAASAQPAPAFDRPVSLKLLLPNLVSDQKRIWTFPARVVKGRNWIPTAVVLGSMAGLLALDPVEGAYFKRTRSFQDFNSVFTSNATVIGTIAIPASLYAIGLIRKDSKMQRTALLAGEAVGGAEILTTVLKDTTARTRPSGVPVGGNFSDTWLDSGGSRLQSHGSFPSGHTIAAFSVATVIARRYRNHRWVPYVAYGMAAVVGLSRLTLSAHFTSDVFMGATLGYAISRFGVLRQ